MARSGAPRGSRSDGEQAKRVLIDTTIAVLAEDGFSATSARAVATRAGVAPGGVFYHFGSMDGLLAAALDELVKRRLARLETAFATDDGNWATRLVEVSRIEFGSPESRANLELVVGARGSEVLQEKVIESLDTSIAFTKGAVERVLGDAPLGGLIAPELIAELAAAAFFGVEVMGQLGRELDLDQLANLAQLVGALTGRNSA